MLYRLEEWQDTTTKTWHCGCMSDLSHGSNYWWHPARILGISPAEYIQWMIDNYKPDKICYTSDKNVIWFEWISQNRMREYKNKMNALARKVNYQI
jgi:hypothetical protein